MRAKKLSYKAGRNKYSYEKRAGERKGEEQTLVGFAKN